MAFLSGMYLFWTLWAGTNGFFFPYILRTVGNQTQAMSVAVQALSFLLGMASIFFIFMKLSDRVNQRLLFEIGRAHVCTPVTNAHLVCRLMLEKKTRFRYSHD